MSTDTHVQCKFSHPDGRVTYGWVNKKPALKVGAVLELQLNCTGEFQKGWRVDEMWAEKPTALIKARERDYKNHRRGTDAKRSGDGGWELPDR